MDSTRGRAFFVSHHPQDRAWAEWVAWELESAGYDVELGHRDWDAGSNLILNIDQAVRTRRIIALLSKHYYEPLRDMTLQWTPVLASERRLVPLRIDDSEPPPLLGTLVAPSLAHLNPDDARQALLNAVDPPRRPVGPRPFPGSPAQPSAAAAVRPTEPAAPDWRSSAALLVGVHSYTSLADVPGVDQNITSLRSLLHSPQFGLPRDQCEVCINPDDPRKVLDALERAIDIASLRNGTLIFYYAGHGAAHPVTGQLLLSTADSRPHVPHSYLDFHGIRGLIAPSAVLRRLILLDCCYSGAALDMLAAPDMAAPPVEGSYVMTSSARTELSRARGNGTCTAFTEALLEVLTDGVPDGPPVLDSETLFQATKRICLSRGWPVPQRQVRNGGDRIPLTANAWQSAPN